jgi:hypothetical protein
LSKLPKPPKTQSKSSTNASTEAAGDVDLATADPTDLPPLVDLPPGAESPSTVLERLRHDER